MQPLSAEQLVGVWERGVGQSPVDRALTLLAAAHPEAVPEELAALSVGARDARLLALRECLFGRALKSFAECPRCSAGLEFSLDIGQLGSREVAEESAIDLCAGDFRLKIRPPDSADLQAAATCADVEGARHLLLERCVIRAERAGESVAVAELPAECIEQIGARLAVAEKHADTLLDLQCIECGYAWQLALDIAAFLWAEISFYARRCLGEVHTLAWAYGWREADILAMSPARRQFYLERVS